MANCINITRHRWKYFISGNQLIFTPYHKPRVGTVLYNELELRLFQLSEVNINHEGNYVCTAYEIELNSMHDLIHWASKNKIRKWERFVPFIGI